MPLAGGDIADRWWGNRRSIFRGGVLMALGQFVLFLSATDDDDPSLAPLVAGGVGTRVRR
jgi:proton-dependent oligopeptide transporter, POT family